MAAPVGGVLVDIAQLFNIVFGSVTALLSALMYNLTRSRNDTERRIGVLADYIKNLRLFDYKYVDAVMFGPRRSGKTSIAELWTSPWVQISEIASSDTWRTYERDLHEFAPGRQFNNELNLEQAIIPTLRLRLRDYPGEDAYRTKAIKELSAAEEKVVIILVLQVDFVNGEIGGQVDNARYYSLAFSDAIRFHLSSISATIEKVIVVFNKADLLPPAWATDDAIERLRHANRDALYQIERLFSGSVDFHLVSALTNRGLIALLGNVGLSGIDAQSEKEEYVQKFRRLEKEFDAERLVV